MQSNLLVILQDIQKDLNVMLMHTIAANNAVSEMVNGVLGAYTTDLHTSAKNWADTFGRLASSQEAFIDDIERLEKLLHDKG